MTSSAGNGGSGGRRSSPFDRMLEDSRARFDALARSRTPPRPATRESRTTQPVGTPPPPAAKPTEPPPAARPREPAKPAAAGEPHDQPYDVRATDIGRQLSSRFGEDWRFELVDKRRDGEDIVVWARLTAGDHDKTRRGRARIEPARAPAAVSGNAAGKDFVLKADGAGSDHAGADRTAAEAAATDAAALQALAACAKGL